jgi:putative flippase GtrA
MISGRFLRFLLTGGVSAVFNLASRFLFNLVVSFELAVALAYVVGMITAYALARFFVFRNSGRSIAEEFKRFAIVNVFSLVLVWSVSVLLARRVFPYLDFNWHAHDIAHFIGVASTAIPSYFGHRAYTFARVIR